MTAEFTGGRRCFLREKAMGFFDKLKQMVGGGHRRPSHHEKRYENERGGCLHQPHQRPGSISRILCCKCGAANQPGTRFCLRCGTAVTAAASACVKCGEALSAKAAYCDKCGERR